MDRMVEREQARRSDEQHRGQSIGAVKGKLKNGRRDQNGQCKTATVVDTSLEHKQPRIRRGAPQVKDGTDQR